MISVRDFWVAFSSLRKSKGYVATIVLTLGITLGALVAMFNLNYQLLAAPLPYADQDRLYVMQCDLYRGSQMDSSSPLNMSPYASVVEAYKKDNSYFEQKALVNFYLETIRDLPDTPQVNATYITPEYLHMLQPPMALGRAFSQTEGLDSHAAVVVISYSTWQQIFKQDPEILNKSIRFGTMNFKVIGVTAEDFVEPQIVGSSRLTQVWLPWDFNRVPVMYRGWGGFIDHEFLVGKIKQNVTLAEIEHELSTRLNARFKEETAAFPYFNEVSLRFRLVSYRQLILGESSARALMLLAGALVLLSIAVVNITNLILARAANQQRNMAIQAALGAQKSHLFNGFFAEVLWLMMLAALLSLLVAFSGIDLLKQVASDLLPRLSELSLTWQSFVFAFFSALLLALLFAFLVSHQVNYRALNGMLQSSGKGVGIQISAKVRKILILTQVALTGILLAASLQILQESLRHLSQPLGLATENIHQAILNMGSQTTAPIEERARNLIAIRDEISNHPKVLNASLASFSPVGETNPAVENIMSIDADFQQQKMANLTFADERYFDILGLELSSGRNFSLDEFQNNAAVVIVNESFARSLQSDGLVLNKRFYSGSGQPGNNLYEVIGIMRDLTLPGEVELPRMFVPSASVDFPRFILKMKPGQVFTKTELNELIAKVNGEYKVSLLISMKDAHVKLLAQDSIAAWLTAALAFLALGLAAIGIYGVLSYSVQLRRFELGIRMAIGARPTTVFLQILKENLAPVVIGLGVALLVLLLLWLWVQQSIYTVPASPLAWTIPIVLILSLAALASLLSVWSIIRKPAINALHSS